MTQIAYEILLENLDLSYLSILRREAWFFLRALALDVIRRIKLTYMNQELRSILHTMHQKDYVTKRFCANSNKEPRRQYDSEPCGYRETPGVVDRSACENLGFKRDQTRSSSVVEVADYAAEPAQLGNNKCSKYCRRPGLASGIALRKGARKGVVPTLAPCLSLAELSVFTKLGAGATK